MEKSKDVKIFSLCYSKKDYEFLDDAVVTPLQVGAALNSEDVCELKDNTGDNISDKNYFYIENTGIYWIWKNVHGCKYKGQMQYRRPLHGVNEKMDFDRIFKNYDVITVEPYNYPKRSKPKFTGDGYIPAQTVEDGYKFSNDAYDIGRLELIINKFYPEYADSYIKYIKKGENLYYSNGFIMSEENYDKYCEFLFGILDKFREIFHINSEKDLWFHVGVDVGAGGFAQRYGNNPMVIWPEAMQWQTEIGGFLSERIWTLWLLHNIEHRRIYNLVYDKQENIWI
jgi:hypothetical protein